jgi:hypothetical protein
LLSCSVLPGQLFAGRETRARHFQALYPSVPKTLQQEPDRRVATGFRYLPLNQFGASTHVTLSSTRMTWREIERRNKVAGRPKKQDSQKTTGKKGSERTK